MANNWFIQEEDSGVLNSDLRDQKVGLAAVSLIGNIAVAGMELSAAKALAKADMHPFWKWATIAGLGGHAASIMHHAMSTLYHVDKPDDSKDEDEDTEEVETKDELDEDPDVEVVE